MPPELEQPGPQLPQAVPAEAGAVPVDPAHAGRPPGGQPQGAPGDRGMLLLRASADRVQRYARKGLVGAHVVPLDGWTAICPLLPVSAPLVGRAGRSTAAGDHVDLQVFAGRPVPRRLRPAVGLYVFGDRAVVTVQSRGRRAEPQWLVWQPGEALVAARPLAPGRFSDLARAAGLPPGPGDPGIARVLLEPSGSAPEVLSDLLSVLRLPGADLLGSLAPASLAGAVEVEPSPGNVARFRATAHEDARERAELEER